MCKSIEKIFKFQIIATLINKTSPNFRRNLDLLCVLIAQVRLRLLKVLPHQFSVLFTCHLNIFHEVRFGCMPRQFHNADSGCSLQI